MKFKTVEISLVDVFGASIEKSMPSLNKIFSKLRVEFAKLHNLKKYFTFDEDQHRIYIETPSFESQQKVKQALKKALSILESKNFFPNSEHLGVGESYRKEYKDGYIVAYIKDDDSYLGDPMYHITFKAYKQ